MSECEHKYRWDIVNNDAWFYCAHCKQAAGALEIESKLNEHATLKEAKRGDWVPLLVHEQETAKLEEENDALKLENGKLERIIQAKIIAMKHLTTEEQHERR